MSRPTRSTDVRKAAINASTVFAITLAIIAGLICAWVFKAVFLKPAKQVTPAPAPTYRVTVMAANVTEDRTIGSQQVKRITVDQATYDTFKAKVADKGEMLTGNQPIGRVTKEPLRAEEPVYESQLLPQRYPVKVSDLLVPGKVAAIVEVPTGNTMARVNDHVDLLCTLTNSDPDLGPTETRTAVMAKNVKVVARFNTTQEGYQPPSRGRAARSPTRPYTLEVTPYRYGLIELSKQLGAAFALRIHAKEETGLATTVAAKGEEAEDPNLERITTDELVKLFGFSRPLPPKYFEIEKFTGVDQGQSHMFLQPGSPAPSTRSNQGGRRGGGLQGPGGRSGGGRSGGGGGFGSGGGGGASPGGGGGGGGGARPGGGGGGGGGKPPAGGGGGGGNRQASSMGSNSALSVDTGLTESGWRRVASNEAGSGAKGKGGNRQSFGGASAMSSGRGVGGLSGGRGGLSGPGGSHGGRGNLGDASMAGAAGCPNCGQKR